MIKRQDPQIKDLSPALRQRIQTSYGYIPESMILEAFCRYNQATLPSLVGAILAEVGASLNAQKKGP